MLLILCGAVFGLSGEQGIEGGLQNGALRSACAFGVSDFAIEDLQEPEEQQLLLLFDVRIESNMHNIIGHSLLWHIRGLLAIRQWQEKLTTRAIQW